MNSYTTTLDLAIPVRVVRHRPSRASSVQAADGTALTSTLRVPVKPARMTREPTFTPHPRALARPPRLGVRGSAL